MLRSLSCVLALSAPAVAQLVEDFESGNPHAFGVEFVTPGTHMASGGNPGGMLELSVSNTTSNLPAATIVPGAAGHPWAGDFRAIGVTDFSYDRAVVSGSSNFGTSIHLLLGSDGGTQTDFIDDTWVWVAMGDTFQFNSEPWATFQVAIPSAQLTLPANWGAAALPNSGNAGLPDNDLWNAVLTDVDYVGLAMSTPFNGGFWFGSHVLQLDNLVLGGASGTGTVYCSPAFINSTGSPAEIGAGGSSSVAANNVTLFVNGLPPNQFGYFLNSRMQAFIPSPTIGPLCLGGMIGRYNSQVFNSGAAGSGSINLDLAQTPTPTGPVAVLAGETWYFQCWYRDLPTFGGSNFSSAVSIDFQ